MIKSNDPLKLFSEGTWIIENIQLVNWGGFQGHIKVPFDPEATLLSGASGTGKSTLLDAYLALMMPSNVAFNGASNDASGRARSAEQRNLVSYLRGKTDDTRVDGSGELKEQVLRGAEGSTWGGIAATYLSTDGNRFTVARLYHVSRSATTATDVTMKLLTCNGELDLRSVEKLAPNKFDKRDLVATIPYVNVHDSYDRFAPFIFTKLGIGESGDGEKALELLARIQGGHQVKSVDQLYKSMVLEKPKTFAKAASAVEHFGDLEDSHQAMSTSYEKSKALARLPELNKDYREASANISLIDGLGINSSEVSPITIWSLRTESSLIKSAQGVNRRAHEEAQFLLSSAKLEVSSLEDSLRTAELAVRDAGGGALAQIEREIERSQTEKESTLERKANFNSRVIQVGLTVENEDDFQKAVAQSRDFLTTFDNNLSSLKEQQDLIKENKYPLLNEQRQLKDEKVSLQGRNGRVPSNLHEARLAITRATGIAVEDLPFIAELVEVKPEEAKWRKAIEVTLFGLSRIMLVEDKHLEAVSSAIDPMDFGVRLKFEGVAKKQHQDASFDNALVSGKLNYKPSPYSHFIQSRIRDLDAICVESPRELTGFQRRVTLSGQTRKANSGAHGNDRSPNIIGFSSVERIAEIDARLLELESEFTGLDAPLREVEFKEKALLVARSVYDYVVTILWSQIDVSTLLRSISTLEGQRAAILKSNGDLESLREAVQVAENSLKEARSKEFASGNSARDLQLDYEGLLSRETDVTNSIKQIESSGLIEVGEIQNNYLSAEFAKVAEPGDLKNFTIGLGKMRSRLLERSRDEREKQNRASESLTTIFKNYQSRWPDPNLGVSYTSYPDYASILDTIESGGLTSRRDEWKRKLTEWSGDDLVPLSSAFEDSIEEIELRMIPINAVLSRLPFGSHSRKLQMQIRRLRPAEVTAFQKELRYLASGVTVDLTDEQLDVRFKRLRKFITSISNESSGRDALLDVRRHVEITAAALDEHGVERATYASFGGKSGGETQELVAFVIGAALYYQLGDEYLDRPRYAPVFLDEGFVKSDAEFAGRAVAAWKELGFQLIIGAPLDKVNALEPYMGKMLLVAKTASGHSSVSPMQPVHV